MTKLRASALLGGLTLVAVVLLVSLGRAQVLGAFSHQYLQTVRKGCSNAIDTGGNLQADVCNALVDTLDKARADGPLDDFAKAIERASRKFFKQPPAVDKCTACVGATSDFESMLATNGTAQLLMGVFTTACFDEFKDPAAENACASAVQEIPEIIDYLLANLPPVPLCQLANRCQ